jgi:exonuclease III
MRLVSWNVARRVTRWTERIAAIAELRPDVLALQEVTPTNIPLYRRDLPALGLKHIVDCFQLAAEPALLKGPRRYGELIASRYPLTALNPAGFEVPWPERVLSAVVHVPTGDVELHTTHVPPGASHDWIKIEHFEGLAARLDRDSDRPRILCGDFNSPKSESGDGTVICWGNGGRWTQGERSVIVYLRDRGLADVFRTLNGHEVEEFSWYWRGRGRQVGRRFDHVFASAGLRASACRYAHGLRETGLSDHSAIVADFSL